MRRNDLASRWVAAKEAPSTAGSVLTNTRPRSGGADAGSGPHGRQSAQRASRPHLYGWPAVHERFFRRFPTRVAVDLELFVALNRLPHGSHIDHRVALLSDFGKGAGWIGVATMFALRGRRRGLVAGLAGLSGLLAATGLVQGVVKRYFRMRRPYAHELAFEVGARPVDSSFPSGHSAASFAAASALTAFYPAAGPLLFAAACGVGLSRVYLGHHFPSDVAVGGALGTGIGLLSAGFWKRWVG